MIDYTEHMLRKALKDAASDLRMASKPGPLAAQYEARADKALKIAAEIAENLGPDAAGIVAQHWARVVRDVNGKIRRAEKNAAFCQGTLIGERCEREADRLRATLAKLTELGLAPGEYRCPTDTQPGVDPASEIYGCGATFTATPDDEGLIDCPNCGMWFSMSEGRRTVPS